MAAQILIVDDDPAVVRLMHAYLRQAGYDVRVAYDGRAALDLLRDAAPDLLLLDLMLPDIDGWAITRYVREELRLTKLPIIMLTARATDTDKIEGLEQGADDYVTKPYNPREVVARVRARLRALDEQPTLPNAQRIEIGGLAIDIPQRRVFVDGGEIELTVTEFDILAALMIHPEYVWTRAQLIEYALGGEFSGIDRTVDSHIRNLRRKIEKDPRRPLYIQTVYGVGYRFEKMEKDR